jgi:hypothetical protein
VICTNEKDISFDPEGNFTIFNERRHFVEDLDLLSNVITLWALQHIFRMGKFLWRSSTYMLKEINKDI